MGRVEMHNLHKVPIWEDMREMEFTADPEPRCSMLMLAFDSVEIRRAEGFQ